MNIDTTLYLVTDSAGFSESEFLSGIEKACRGGTTLVQLREKEKTGREYFELAVKVKEITNKFNIPLIIDDRIDIALACNADGVHVGRDDLPVRLARKLLGDGKIVGATAKTVQQAIKAAEEGADYLGVGAIYPTTTKVKTILTDIKTLNDICANVDIPVVAIGGLNKDNCDILRNSPIGGVAAVSAIMKAQDIEAAAAELKKTVLRIKNGHIML